MSGKAVCLTLIIMINEKFKPWQTIHQSDRAFLRILVHVVRLPHGFETTNVVSFVWRKILNQKLREGGKLITKTFIVWRAARAANIMVPMPHNTCSAISRGFGISLPTGSNF